MFHIRLFVILAATLFVAAPAFAGDWVVTRLRGTVEQLVGETWVPLKRGDSIEYDRDVRTLSDGHAELQRNLEVLTLDVNTAIRIQHDTETGFTTVLQDFGRLDVDAEVKRVKHFAVQTAYLAAVVKGTHFIVTTDLDGSTVEVDRGAVAVTSAASERSTTITIGQTATVNAVSAITQAAVQAVATSNPAQISNITQAAASAVTSSAASTGGSDANLAAAVAAGHRLGRTGQAVSNAVADLVVVAVPLARRTDARHVS